MVAHRTKTSAQRTSCEFPLILVPQGSRDVAQCETRRETGPVEKEIWINNKTKQCTRTEYLTAGQHFAPAKK